MSPLRSSAIAGICVLSLLSSLRAEEKLLVVNSTARGSVKLVDVGSGATTQINSDRLHFPRGAVLDLGGDLIVTTPDGVRRYVGAMNGQQSAGIRISRAIHRPHGPSLDTATGDLYVVGRSRRHLGLFRLPRDPQAQGGFGPAEPIGLPLPSSSLADTKVAGARSGELAPGDVLVLSKKPAAIFRFVRTDDGFQPSARVFTNAFPHGARPTGMTFSVGPSGCEILVSDSRGTIHRFDASGDPLGSFNDAGAHPGLRQVTSSVGSGQPVVYASLREGRVLKFTVDDEGTAADPDGEAIPASFSRPDGLGAVNAVPTLPGDGVVVRPAFGVELKFDHVDAPGFTSAELSFTQRPLVIPDDMDFTLPSGNRIPGDVIPPLAGDARIPLVRLDTTAGFTGTFRLEGDEEALLAEGGSLPELLQQLDASELVRWMFAPEINAPNNEPPTAECGSTGCEFTDITTGLGSHIGRGWGFSEFIIVRDTRGDGDGEELTRIQVKLVFLNLTLESGRVPDDLHALTGLVEDYTAAMAAEDFEAAKGILDAFINEVRDADLPNSPSDNVAGELVARARALKFSTCTFIVSSPEEINDCVGEQ